MKTVTPEHRRPSGSCRHAALARFGQNVAIRIPISCWSRDFGPDEVTGFRLSRVSGTHEAPRHLSPDRVTSSLDAAVCLRPKGASDQATYRGRAPRGFLFCEVLLVPQPRSWYPSLIIARSPS